MSTPTTGSPRTRGRWIDGYLLFTDSNNFPVTPLPHLLGYSVRDDFFRFSTNEYTLTTVEAGAGDATEVVSGPAGLLTLTNDAEDNDSDQIQWIGEPFKLAANKSLWFEARLKVSDATQSDLICGLCITDTTLIGGMTDGIYFRKDDGDANIDFVTEKDSTATSTDTGVDLVDDTYIRLGFLVDGTSSATPYINGIAKTAQTTNLPDDEDLTFSLALMNGEAVAKSVTIDYWTVHGER